MYNVKIEFNTKVEESKIRDMVINLAVALSAEKCTVHKEGTLYDESCDFLAMFKLEELDSLVSLLDTFNKWFGPLVILREVKYEEEG